MSKEEVGKDVCICPLDIGRAGQICDGLALDGSNGCVEAAVQISACIGIIHPKGLARTDCGTPTPRISDSGGLG